MLAVEDEGLDALRPQLPGFSSERVVPETRKPSARNALAIAVPE
jgi:hypothetical protein